MIQGVLTVHAMKVSELELPPATDESNVEMFIRFNTRGFTKRTKMSPVQVKPKVCTRIKVFFGVCRAVMRCVAG